MKVLVPGNEPADQKYHQVCGNCGCEFEFERCEANVLVDRRYGNALTVNCPSCSAICNKSLGGVPAK